MARKSPPSLQSLLDAAEKAGIKFTDKAAKLNKRAEKSKSKMAVKKYQKKAKKYARKAAQQKKVVAEIKAVIEAVRIQTIRIRSELNAQKHGIVALFQSVLGDAQGRQFAKKFGEDPQRAVTKTLLALAKDQRALYRRTDRGPRDIRDYNWKGSNPKIIPAEAVMLLVPALTRCQHQGRSKAFTIVRNRLAKLKIHRDNCVDNQDFPGWRKSCGRNGWWVARMSAFVRDVLPVLPALKHKIDGECRGCKPCRAARRC